MRDYVIRNNALAAAPQVLLDRRHDERTEATAEIGIADDLTAIADGGGVVNDGRPDVPGDFTVRLILLALFVVAMVVLAVTKPEVRDSRLVRVGATVLLVTFGMLSWLPGIGTGLLFLFSVPIALLLILVGTILSFVKSDKRMNEDVAALTVAAKRSSRVWPDDSRLPQVDQVARHGLRAGPALLSLLRFESEEQLNDETWNPTLEQQAELALCRIYGELPSGTRTVYDIRAMPAENRQVKQFWEAKVRSAGGHSATSSASSIEPTTR